MLKSPLVWIAAVIAAPAWAAPPLVGVTSFEITDPARPDPVSADHRRTWRVDLYYPAKDGKKAKAPYAPQPALAETMAADGYYDVPAETIRGWSRTPGPAIADAAAADPKAKYPLILVAPGSGLASFNYSRLAAALTSKGYAVAVVALPYVGISELSDHRILKSEEFPGLDGEDPVKWRPAIRQWSADLSRTIDRLLDRGFPVEVDPARIAAVGHSTGGTVALQLCREDKRPLGCGDFEGTPQASDAFEGGNSKPIFVTASRSAKPDRPFQAPDFSNPFWSYLAKDNRSAWGIAITEASHMSFSDAPYVMPATLTRFGGVLMSADRSFELMTGIVDAFARAYGPNGRGDGEFQAYLSAQPEVLGKLATAK